MPAKASAAAITEVRRRAWCVLFIQFLLRRKRELWEGAVPVRTGGNVPRGMSVRRRLTSSERLFVGAEIKTSRRVQPCIYEMHIRILDFHTLYQNCGVCQVFILSSRLTYRLVI